jgi:ribosomal protein S27E
MKAAPVTAEIDALRQQVESYFTKNPVRFKILNIDSSSLSVKIECQKCGYEFTASHENSALKYDHHQFAITCPLCSNMDETNQQRFFEKLEVAKALIRLRELERQAAAEVENEKRLKL